MIQSLEQHERRRPPDNCAQGVHHSLEAERPAISFLCHRAGEQRLAHGRANTTTEPRAGGRDENVPRRRCRVATPQTHRRYGLSHHGARHCVVWFDKDDLDARFQQGTDDLPGNVRSLSLLATKDSLNNRSEFGVSASTIPLKANAWLDMSKRKAGGENIDSKDIAKHRNDVFRLAGTLPGVAGPKLPKIIVDDLISFLGSFPENSPEWPPILASLRGTLGGGVRPAALRSAIETFFRLSA